MIDMPKIATMRAWASMRANGQSVVVGFSMLTSTKARIAGTNGKSDGLLMRRKTGQPTSPETM